MNSLLLDVFEPGANKNQRTEDVYCTQAHFSAVALAAALVLLT
jgi:hypothetical protein